MCGIKLMNECPQDRQLDQTSDIVHEIVQYYRVLLLLRRYCYIIANLAQYFNFVDSIVMVLSQFSAPRMRVQVSTKIERSKVKECKLLHSNMN